MDHPTTLIYLADGETLGQLHRDWPTGLRVALCLEERGQSDIVFVRDDEIADTPERVAALLGRDDADFVIVPVLGGYPTRRLSFSEEQQLCGMLADMEALPEQALAYLESRDPLDPPGMPVADEKVLEDDVTYDTPMVEDLPPVVTERRKRSPRIVRPDAAPMPEVEVARPAPVAVTGQWAMVERTGPVLTFTMDGVDAMPSYQDDVYAHPVALSDDRRRLQALLSLGPHEALQLPAVFHIPVRDLPSGCPEIPAGAPQRVFVRAEGPALTITLPIVRPAAVEPAAVTPAGQPAPAKPRRRSFLGPAFAAVVALAMVQIGTSQEAKDIMRVASMHSTAFQDE